MKPRVKGLFPQRTSGLFTKILLKVEDEGGRWGWVWENSSFILRNVTVKFSFS